MKRTLLLLVLLTALASTSWAFDGNRKGFVLGGGLGFAPAAKWSVNDNFLGFINVDTSETKAGVAVHILVGYAWDEHNMIVYEGNGVGYKTDFFSNYVIDPRDRSAFQGFDGAAWYHYFGPTGKSFFSTVGVGLYYFKVEDFKENDAGGAFLFGGGYEFARHFQFGLYVSAGRTTSAGVDFNHSQISMLISGIAF